MIQELTETVWRLLVSCHERELAGEHWHLPRGCPDRRASQKTHHHLHSALLLALHSVRQTMRTEREKLRIFLERESLMKSLEESKERRNLLETTSDWIWETDRDGLYTYSSPKVEDLLGYQPEHAIGKALLDFGSPNQAAMRCSLPATPRRQETFQRL